jgi:general secretion pathway protein L
VVRAFTAIESATANAFAWWIDELASLVPTALRRMASPPRERLILDVSGPDICIRRGIGQQVRLLARFDDPEISEIDADHCRRKLFRRINMSRVDVAIRLPSDNILVKEVALPTAAEHDLTQALGFLIDRETPFSEKEVYYDFRLVRREEAKEQIVVELFATPRRCVNDALERTSRLALHPMVIEGARTSGGQPVCIDLRSRNQRPGKIGALSFRHAMLVLSSLGLIVAMIVVPLARRADTAHSLAAEVGRLKKDAEVALTLRAELGARRNAGTFLQARRMQYAPVVATVAELTRLLDDEIWLVQLRLNPDEVRLIGYAPEAAALVGIIDQSPYFKTPRFISPITKDPRLDLERFQMAFGFEAPKS